MVLSRTGGRYRLWHEGAFLEAVLRGRMKHRREETVLVGDHVTFAEGNEGPATIEAIQPRRSLLRRRSPGKTRGARAIAANLDQVVVVGAARMPDWEPHLIDRFIAVAAANQLPATIVINKTDLDPEAKVNGEPYRLAGYRVLCTSALTGVGVDALGALLAGKVSLFTGPTGVGKSSLLNALVPGLHLRTGEVSPRSHGGRHTTVAAEMLPLGDGGFVVDTPGLRDIGLWGVSAQEAAAAFPDVLHLAGDCRFDDCRHREEPGCAVRDAVAGGKLADTRLTSFLAMREEADAAARPWR